MKGIIIAIIGILIMVAVGWLSFGISAERATINVETDEIREDTAQAVEATQEFAEDAAQGVRGLAQEVDEHVDVHANPDEEAGNESPANGDQLEK